MLRSLSFVCVAVLGTLTMYSASAANQTTPSQTFEKEKLMGKWCYTHMEIEGEREDKNKPYELFDNGEFTYKNSKDASKTRKATYTFDGSKLSMGNLVPGGITIVELTDTIMVGDGLFTSRHYFSRGQCKG